MLVIERLKLLLNSTSSDIEDGLDMLYEEKGWTPPQDKEPEPEFKPGDYVEVKNTSPQAISPDWDLRRYTDEIRFSSLQIRHAPTWIKWESGKMPHKYMKLGTVCEASTRYRGGISTGKQFIEMDDGRWAWMPEVE